MLQKLERDLEKERAVKLHTQRLLVYLSPKHVLSNKKVSLPFYYVSCLCACIAYTIRNIWFSGISPPTSKILSTPSAFDALSELTVLKAFGILQF